MTRPLPDTAPPPAHDPYASLRYPNFRWFVASLFAMTIGTQIQIIVVSWQVYTITRDPFALGMVGLAEALPFIGCALFAGHVADRTDRRRVSMQALGVLLACALVLLALSLTGGLHQAGRLGLIYALIALTGVARSFLQPARQALGAELVPRATYANAVAWRSSSWQVGAVAGPAVGGLLYGFAGVHAAYAVVAALLLVAMLCLSRVRHASRVLPGSDTPLRDSLTVGLRFVRGQPVLLGALTLDLFSVFFGGATALLPIFAEEILRVGPQGLGVLRAAPAAGAVLMSLYLAHRPPLSHAGRALLISVAAYGVCIIGFGLSRSFGLSLVLLAVSGVADQVSVVIRSTLLQVLTPEHLLGRVSSVNQIFIGSSNEIGEAESGTAAKLMGAVPAVVFGGVMTLIVVGVTAWRVPQLRKLRRLA